MNHRLVPAGEGKGNAVALVLFWKSNIDGVLLSMEQLERGELTFSPIGLGVPTGWIEEKTMERRTKLREQE
ncbi:hypothetical protein PM082_012518 [Marasmius tenuissimus]|nr:hypothetical protein PM082_012518 [Marasmius tenuissimus]